MQLNQADNQTSSEPKDLGTIVAEYFLEIYRMYLKASPHAPAECRLLEVFGSQNNRRTYELRIIQNEVWKSRRMTLMPLGEGSGSKSKCFYAVYDDHLVVKIPPVAVTDFSKYVEYLQAEQKIAIRLAPRVCITPSVSVIMRHAFPFSDDEAKGRSSEEEEAAYVKWLEDNPDAQEYLKINDGFVFFMDLAKYFILADVLDSMHGRTRDSIDAEIRQNTGVLLDIQGFEGRYGYGTGHISEALAIIYREYENALRDLLGQAGVTVSSVQYKFIEWLSSHLAGKNISLGLESSIPPEIVPDMDRLIKTLLDENLETVALYRETIQRYLVKKSFSRSRTQMANIIANIIDLLAYMGRKQVAMRDFKPDNLLAAGDPARYPQFLSTVDAFQLGLIDVETAIIIDPKQIKPSFQPRLGGTPLFSTPSQLVPNDLLAQAYGDVHRIFFLQDWHAAMVMMYHVVTDDNLFMQTAKILPVIIRTIQKAAKEKRLNVDVVAAVSRSFWTSAVSEYRQNLSQREKMLRAVNVIVPRKANWLIEVIFQEETERIEARISKLVADQTFYKTEKNQEQLLKASNQQIKGLLFNLTESGLEAGGPGRLDGVQQFLTALLAEKNRLAECREFLGRLQSPEPARLDLFELLNLFFNCVYRIMYPEKWAGIDPVSLLQLPTPLKDASSGA